MTDRITVARAWTSGYYLAELVLTDGPDAGRGSWVPFIVREPPRQGSAVLVQAPVNTWQAYNDWGGRSLYFNFNGDGDNHVSFDRPYNERTMKTADGPATDNANLPQISEFPLVRFLERGGYDVSYTTDVDTDASPGELLRHRLVMVAGHDEYWTKRIRDAFERARDLGTNLAFVGANIDFWQMRYENGRRTIVEYRKAVPRPGDGSGARRRCMFRELVASATRVPAPRRPGHRRARESEHRDQGSHREPRRSLRPLVRAHGLRAHDRPAGLVGYEWDLISPGCATPPLTVLFHTPGTPSFDAVRYTAASGARVFSAGTLRFSWGLDPASAQSNAGLQQFMRNALDDLTRPAPPTSLRAVRTRAGVRIAVGWPTDPRPRELLVYARTGSQPFLPATRGARLVCRTRGATCMDSLAARSRPVRYVAILRDRWRPSVPLLSRTVR